MNPHPLPEPVDIARVRRAELLAAINALERALASPAGSPAWAAKVEARVQALTSAFDDHVHATESPDGMYAEILGSAPRLKFAVDQLMLEHNDARAAIRVLDTLVRDVDGTDPESIERVRSAATELLVALLRHRQRGADLVFEAYAQDIGGLE